MKNLQFIVGILLIFLISCASPEKLIEKGKYDKLFDRALRKAEKSNGQLDSEWLRGMAHVYNTFQKNDSIELARIMKRASSVRDWNQVKSLANEITYRQNRLASVMPVYDEKGRTRNFINLNSEKWHDHAVQNINAYYYQDGLAYLEKGREGSKSSARKAAQLFRRISGELAGDSKVLAYMREAEELATIHIYVDDNRRYLGNSVERLIDRIEEPYIRLYSGGEMNRTADIVLNIRDYSTDISRYVEEVTNHHFSKEVVVKTEEKKYWNAKDSIWETETKEFFDRVHATVYEVNQIKRAVAYLDVEVRTGNVKAYRDELVARSDFDNYFSYFEGDKRALDDDPEDYVRGRRLNPPGDFEMAGLLEEQIGNQFEHWFREQDWWRVVE